jgi:predicted metal-dependent hydrolase
LSLFPSSQSRAAEGSTHWLSVEGLKIQVSRKRVRTLRLTVRPPQGELRLSAPLRLAEGQLLDFVRAKLAWIRKQQQRVAAQALASVALETPQQQALLRRELKAQIPPLIAEWEGRLGVRVLAWGVRAMRSRWGSCNTRSGRLSFSLELAKKAPELLEYIVVHEMCHLLEASHGPRFKALMDRHLPHWKQHRSLLNGRQA